MNIKKKVLTGLTAVGVAFGGLGLTAISDPGSITGPQVAQAVPYKPGQEPNKRVYGKPGCISDPVMRPHHVDPDGSVVYYSHCIFRTSTGYTFGYFNRDVSYIVDTPGRARML